MYPLMFFYPLFARLAIILALANPAPAPAPVVHPTIVHATTTTTDPIPSDNGSPCTLCTPGNNQPGGLGSANGVPISAYSYPVNVLLPDGFCAMTGTAEQAEYSFPDCPS